MNELMNIKLGKDNTITSMDLVDIINEFRKEENGEEYKELRHDTLMTKIKKEIKTLNDMGINSLQNFLESKYTNQRGKEYDCFSLNRDGMLQILNSESTFVRYKTIEYVNKLENKVKEITQNPYEALSPELKAIFTLDKKQQAIEEEVKDLKDSLTLSKAECDELQAAVHKIGVSLLGGKNKKAYKDVSLRSRVYSDIQQQLRREFGVNKYSWIKHNQFERAKEIVNNYKLPLVLEDEIILANNQLEMEDM